MIPFIDLSEQQKKIKNDLDRRISKVLMHGKYILGPEVYELEEKLASYVGVKHCITCANGTDALLIALMALGIGKDDEVITSPFTYVATGEVITRLGAKAIFVDIDPKTYNIDPDKIESKITQKTKAILPVSIYGQCANFTHISKIAQKYGLPVVEDGAQSFGATHYGKRSCSLSTIGCTSFFPTKPLGCYGDGGACFTDDDNLAKEIKTIRWHGQDRKYHYIRFGLNSRLDTLQAAVLLSKLEIFDTEVKLRQSVGEKYTKILQGNKDIVTPFIESNNTSVYCYYTIQVKERDFIRNKLLQDGIPTIVYYPEPLHLQSIFKKKQKNIEILPIAEQSSDHILSLPMNAWITDEQLSKIAEIVLKNTK